MSIFGNILDKLGLKKKAPETKAAPAATGPAVKTPTMKGVPAAKPTVAKPAPVAGGKPAMFAKAPQAEAAISVVDVVGKLEALAAGKQLNWKVSIVDLLTLLGLDSSFEARKELATELGCPAENMGDSARMNVWLHKTVLQKLAEHGGNIPPELLN